MTNKRVSTWKQEKENLSITIDSLNESVNFLP